MHYKTVFGDEFDTKDAAANCITRADVMSVQIGRFTTCFAPEGIHVLPKSHWSEVDNIGGANEKSLQSSSKRGRYDDWDANRSSQRENVGYNLELVFLDFLNNGNIIHNVTCSEIAGVGGRLPGNQQLDDARYRVCRGHKVTKVIGINLRGTEPRMLALYGDPERIRMRDIELVPCRILRFYAPQKVIDFYEGLLERTIRRP
ncbi:unnamed protein product [Angiostrongylus costaricensis]|uniref:DUF4417 domain-containing protein n=1 Tax=Angiostrongylus costaricensis TaxID=334426 RepID=A0A158PEL9_ANGCS|nr:unnamed protein product [Angiostrongylus costaricensis]